MDASNRFDPNPQGPHFRGTLPPGALLSPPSPPALPLRHGFPYSLHCVRRHASPAYAVRHPRRAHAGRHVPPVLNRPCWTSRQLVAEYGMGRIQASRHGRRRPRYSHCPLPRPATASCRILRAAASLDTSFLVSVHASGSPADAKPDPDPDTDADDLAQPKASPGAPARSPLPDSQRCSRRSPLRAPSRATLALARRTPRGRGAHHGPLHRRLPNPPRSGFFAHQPPRGQCLLLPPPARRALP